jgi:hypothetical protein
MVVAVIAVRMVQVAFHQVIGVIAVGHGRVATGGPMLVGFLVTTAVVRGRARSRVRGADGQGIFLDLAAVLVVQVAVVQVIDMAIVPDGRVAALGAMLVGVAFVMSRHVSPLLPGKDAPSPRQDRWRGPGRSPSDRPAVDPPWLSIGGGRRAVAAAS